MCNLFAIFPKYSLYDRDTTAPKERRKKKSRSGGEKAVLMGFDGF
jgi:hypothetical protein